MKNNCGHCECECEYDVCDSCTEVIQENYLSRFYGGEAVQYSTVNEIKTNDKLIGDFKKGRNYGKH